MGYPRQAAEQRENARDLFQRRRCGHDGRRGEVAIDLAAFALGRSFATILADPPWRFQNRTGKVAPEHRRLSRYETMTLEDICALPVEGIAAETAHLYLWTPNALLPEALEVMRAWGFSYTSPT